MGKRESEEDLHSVHVLMCRELASTLECWNILAEDINIARNGVYCSSNTVGNESFGQALVILSILHCCKRGDLLY